MDHEQRKQLGDRIRAARTEKGWSQARLATEAGVSENTVLSIESAKRTPQGEKLRAILDALGMVTPVDGALDLEGVPEDFQIFLRVAAKRGIALAGPEYADRRARILADIYPRLLAD